MALSKKEIIDLYRRRARNYNFTANLYYLLGFREWKYREEAVRALEPAPGDTVVEIGCGTGLNFPLLRRAVGPEGRIIGVDMTDAMLEQARRRVEKNGWSNIELVKSDAAEYCFPSGIDGVISTFALTLSPQYDSVIRNGCAALNAGKRWVILDLKIPSGFPARLVPLAVLLTKPFGVSMDLSERHPWESLAAYMPDVSFSERYGGFVYIATGTRRREAWK